MPFDATKVPPAYADLFYHGIPSPTGVPLGLTDAEYDAQKARMIEAGEWPLHPKKEDA